MATARSSTAAVNLAAERKQMAAKSKTLGTPRVTLTIEIYGEKIADFAKLDPLGICGVGKRLLREPFRRSVVASGLKLTATCKTERKRELATVLFRAPVIGAPMKNSVRHNAG